MHDNNSGGKFVSVTAIDAYRLPLAGEDVPESFTKWCDKVGLVNFESGRNEALIIRVGGRDHEAPPGYWVIKNALGTFSVMPDEMFQIAYRVAEPVGDSLEENVRYLLDNYKGTVRDMSGDVTGDRSKEFLAGSLALTFLAMKHRLNELEALVGASAP